MDLTTKSTISYIGHTFVLCRLSRCNKLFSNAIHRQVLILSLANLGFSQIKYFIQSINTPHDLNPLYYLK